MSVGLKKKENMDHVCASIVHLDLVPIYDSSPWRCAYAAWVLRVPMPWTVKVYLATEIFVLDIQLLKFQKQICFDQK